MIERSKTGKLIFKILDFEIFIGDIFEKCKTESEVEFAKETMTDILDCAYEEKIKELDE